MSQILSEGVECPSCAEKSPQDAVTCGSCGAALRVEDPSLSVTAGAGLDSGHPRVPGEVPLEASPNFILLQKAANGARDASMPPEEYRAAVKRLRTLSDIGQKIMSTDLVKDRVAALPEDQRAACEDLLGGFVDIDAGTTRMLAWLTSGDLLDVTEGAALAERGFRLVERARDTASWLFAQESGD
ncbi:MAG: hypothetical protein EB084_15925 [Proteobacteria bacterium]|nr:hypothetical protein [Pseudomonadota bacterium]